MTKTSGFDEITNKLIKDLKEEIAAPLTALINNSIDTGIILTKLKTAKVIPLFKSGDKQTFGNYRPISLLSVCLSVIVFYFRDVHRNNKAPILYITGRQHLEIEEGLN